MQKYFVFFFVLYSFLILPVFPQETITITTYYPAPFGVYEELRAVRMAIGENYIKGNQYCWSGGCTHPIDAGVDLVVEGNVGIGTVTPSERLEVTDGRILLRSVTDVSPSNASLMFQNLPGDRWHIGINDTIDSLSIADTLEQNVITLRNMDGNRNVGIGNSLPQAKLDVSGEVKIGNTGLVCNADTAGAIRYNSGKLQYCDNTSNWVWLQPAPTIVSGLFEGINYDCKDCGLSLTVNTQTWTYTYLASNPTKLANTIIFKTKYRGDIPQINNIKTVFAVPASSIDPGYDIDGGINVEVVRLQEHEFTISIGRLANQHEQPFSVSFIVVGE